MAELKYKVGDKVMLNTEAKEDTDGLLRRYRTSSLFCGEFTIDHVDHMKFTRLPYMIRNCWFEEVWLQPSIEKHTVTLKALPGDIVSVPVTETLGSITGTIASVVLQPNNIIRYVVMCKNKNILSLTESEFELVDKQQVAALKDKSILLPKMGRRLDLERR